jgi:hypothetical protein
METQTRMDDMANIAEQVFDPEERAGLQAFGFTLEPNGTAAELAPREVSIETSGCMEVTVTHHPNDRDYLFMGFHNMVGTIAGIEHRGERFVDEKGAERDAGLIELGFVDEGEHLGFRWEGTIALSLRIEKKDHCHFDVDIKFPNGDKLYVECDFLCGKIRGAEWADSYQRAFHGLDPSALLTPEERKVAEDKQSIMSLLDTLRHDATMLLDAIDQKKFGSADELGGCMGKLIEDFSAYAESCRD